MVACIDDEYAEYNIPVNEVVTVQPARSVYSVRELTALSTTDHHHDVVEQHEPDYDDQEPRFTVKHEHEPEFVYVKDERDLNDMDDCSTVIPVRLYKDDEKSTVPLHMSSVEKIEKIK